MPSVSGLKSESVLAVFVSTLGHGQTSSTVVSQTVRWTWSCAAVVTQMSSWRAGRAFPVDTLPVRVFYGRLCLSGWCIFIKRQPGKTTNAQSGAEGQMIYLTIHVYKCIFVSRLFFWISKRASLDFLKSFAPCIIPAPCLFVVFSFSVSYAPFWSFSPRSQSPLQVWVSLGCTSQESCAASMQRDKAERGGCVPSSHLYFSQQWLPSPEPATTSTTGKVRVTEKKQVVQCMMTFAQFSLLIFSQNLFIFTHELKLHSWSCWVKLFIPMCCLLLLSPLLADVLVGSLLGLAIAWLCYRQHYPPLQDPDCYRPLRHRETVPAAQERKLANSNYILPL